MKIGIIGGGTVGHATARCYMEWAEVRVWDVDKSRRTHPFPDDVLCCDVVFVCVPETEVHSFLADHCTGRWRDTNLVIRSTVPIGTTRQLRTQYGLTSLVHSPEFLTERCAVVDAMTPARNIVGGPPGSGVCCTALIDLYERRFPGVPVLTMTSDESEAVKLIQNGFSAVKVAFFNEVRCLTDKLGLDWETVRTALLAGGWINPMHTLVPGPDGKYGFGGKCLPKDLLQLIHAMEDACSSAPVCRAAYERNKYDREQT